MKKFRLLLAAVLITATLSAFTTKLTGTTYYRTAGGEFIENTGQMGECLFHEEYACEYVWSSTPEDNDPQNPNNYEEVPGTENKYFDF